MPRGSAAATGSQSTTVADWAEMTGLWMAERRTVVDVTSQQLSVSRGPYRLHAEMVPGLGVPVVLMHGFPDSIHLYDRLVPHLAGRAPVVRFDFLGWGRSDKPPGYPYTAANQAGDLAAVVEADR